MNLIERIKEKLFNMDVNSFLASVISTIGAITTTDIIQFIYLIAAVVAQIFAMKISHQKEIVVREQMKEDLELKREERLMKIEERRTLMIQNDKILQDYANKK